MKKVILGWVAFVCLVVTQSVSVMAHDVYKEPLEERYGLKTVSCKTCHPNSKDRSIHNTFGHRSNLIKTFC